jgi:alpha-tubulin suppressor-like RCC1 family protein
MALLSDGSVVCWGEDTIYSQCGDNIMPSPILAKGPTCLTSAELGQPMSAGMTPEGRVQVWGPELGGTAAGDGPGPGPAFGQHALVDIPTSDRIVSISPGSPMLALTDQGDVFAWGVNLSAITVDKPTLYPMPERVVATGRHCMLTETESVYCFGSNGEGKLGLPDLEVNQYEPVRIDLDGVVGLSEMVDYACAVLDDGSVWCWGSNGSSRLGLPFPEVGIHPAPSKVEGIPPASKVFTGSTGTCAVARDGVAWCWSGSDILGEPMLPPIPWRPDLRFVDIGGGFLHFCGLLDDGRVYCDGSAAFGCTEQGVIPCFVDIDSAIDGKSGS